MKSLLGKLGIVLVIGLAIFTYAKVWGADWKLYGQRNDMNWREWLEIIWGRAEKVSATVNGNLVQGWLLKATRNIRQDGILYLHGGTFDLEKPIINRFTDALSYRVMGYHVLLLKFPDEDENAQPNPNLDIPEIRDAPILFRGLVGIDKIHIITVSRGGYPGLFAFQQYPELFDRFVAICPPIDADNQDWLRTQHDWAVKYLTQKLPSPMTLAEQGAFSSLASRMLMIGGANDTTCPPISQSEKFAKTVGCASVIVPKYGHNVSMSTKAREEAMQFIQGGKVVKLRR
jgi:pimeloyl-ACP methyl ester carboxylesterase